MSDPRPSRRTVGLVVGVALVVVGAVIAAFAVFGLGEHRYSGWR